MFLKEKGYLLYIIEEYSGRSEKGIIPVKIDGEKVRCKINDDVADAICIGMYGILPEKQQKLKEEKF